MKLFNKLLDLMPMHTLIVMTVFLALLPYLPFFIEPPHLFSKLGMLVRAELTQPVDIFDLFVHVAPVPFLVAKLIRVRHLKNTT